MKYQSRTKPTRWLVPAVWLLLLTVAAHAGVTLSSSAVTVTISTPTNLAKVGTPFTLKATSPSGATGWYVYSDNVAVWHVTGSTSISPSLSLTAGTHKLLARAWNSTGTYGDAWVTVTVAAGTPVPTPPSNAFVIDHIEDKTPWGSCTVCAATPGNPNPPTAIYSQAQFQTTPSLDGSSLMFSISGSDPYADALHWIKFGPKNAYRNFIWDFWVYVNSDSLRAQNLEFDLFQSVSGKKYMFGTQCNYNKGIWQTWNATAHWLDTTIPCTKFQPGTWTRVVWYLQRTTDNRVRYISLSVGNTTYTLNQYQLPEATSWGDTFGVQFQQDMNSVPSSYFQWVDRVKVSMW